MKLKDFQLAPPYGGACHEVHMHLAAIRQCLDTRALPEDADICNGRFLDIESLFEPRGEDAVAIECHTTAAITLDELAMVRRRRNVSDLDQLVVAENAAVRCALRLWLNTAGPKGGLLSVDRVLDRALLLWSELGDDTRESIVAHVSSLDKYFFLSRGKFLEAVDTFTDSIETRFRAIARTTKSLRKQLSLVIGFWWRLARTCGREPSFRTAFLSRAPRLLRLVIEMELVGSVARSLAEFHETFQALHLPKDKANRMGAHLEQMQAKMVPLGHQLSDWVTGLPAADGRHVRWILDRLLPYLRGDPPHRPRRVAEGASVRVLNEVRQPIWTGTQLLDLCSETYRAVALAVPLAPTHRVGDSVHLEIGYGGVGETHSMDVEATIIREVTAAHDSTRIVCRFDSDDKVVDSWERFVNTRNDVDPTSRTA